MAAYEYVLTGKILHHLSNRQANSEALRMLNRAIELDPNYAHAHAWKACVTGQAWRSGWSEDPDGCVQIISDELQVAPTTRRLLGQLFEFTDLGEHELKGHSGLVVCRACSAAVAQAASKRASLCGERHLSGAI